LSSLTTTDLYYTDVNGLYVYAYRPCSISPICYKTSACQLSTGANAHYLHTVSIYDKTSTDCSVSNNRGCFNYTLLYADPAPLPQQVPLGLRAVQNANGDSVGCVKDRGLIVNFLCSPLSQPVLYQVQDEGCLYEFTIYTAAACLQ